MGTELIAAHNVTFFYDGAAAGPALAGLNISVGDGELIALAGPNGSGKSTLVQLAAGLYAPSSGTIAINGVAATRADDLVAARRFCGLLLPVPAMQIVGNTVEEDVAFGPGNLGMPPAELRACVTATLAEFNISHLRSRQSQTLSGGEAQLVALAGLLAMRPPLLLLDEPTAHLDACAVARLWEAVMSLCRDQGRTIIWITHSAEEIARCSRVICLCRGEKIFDGTPAELWRATAIRERAGLPLPARERLLCDLGGENVPAEPRAYWHELSRMLPAVSPVAQRTMTADPPLYACKEIRFAYQIDRHPRNVFREFSGSFGEESTLLVGASGCGKTTLQQLLFGFLAPQAGELYFRGVPLTGRGKRFWQELRRTVGLLVQFPERQFFAPTVLAELAWGLRWRGVEPAAAEARVKSWLAERQCLPTALLHRDPLTLSLGEQRLVAIFSVLVTAPEVLLLDEPLCGLDRHHREQVLALLRLFIAGGGALLCATQQPAALWELATSVAVLAGNRLEHFFLDGPGHGLHQAMTEAGVAPPAWMDELAAARRAGVIDTYPARYPARRAGFDNVAATGHNERHRGGGV